MGSIAVGDMTEGRVIRWFSNVPRPYGFVAVVGVERDLFAPLSHAVAGELRIGDHVRFEVRMDRRGRLYADGLELV